MPSIKTSKYHVADGKIVGDVIMLGIYDVRNDVMNDSEKVILTYFAAIPGKTIKHTMPGT